MDANQYLKVWLRFDESPTKDECGNAWTVYKNPTVGTDNAFNGNALQLSGGSYVYTPTPIEIGGQDFTIDFWACPTNLSISYSGFFSFKDNLIDGNERDVVALLGLNYSQLIYGVFDTSGNRLTNDFKTSHHVTSSLQHFAFSYRHSDKTIFIFVDGHLVWSEVLKNSLTRAARYVFIGRLAKQASEYMEGAVDEFRIYDGIARWTEDFTPPTLFDYGGDSATVSFTVDTVRHVRNPLFEWRYENYGTADLLTIAGTTVTNLPNTQSKTGSAFYQPNRQKCFDIPSTNEIWIKCDVFIANNNSGNRIRVYSSDGNGINGWSTDSSRVSNAYLLWHNDTAITGKYRPTIASMDDGIGLNVLWLHMKSGSSDGLIEFFVADVKEGRVFTAANINHSFTGNVNAGNPFNNVYIQMDGSNIYVSNLIISNVEVGFNDNVKPIGFPWQWNFDVEREVTPPTFPMLVTVLFDFQRFIRKTVNVAVDVQRNVIASVIDNFDVQRTCVTSTINNFDVQRNVIASVIDEFDALRQLPNHLFIMPVKDGVLYGRSSTVGVREVEISIGAQQLTDQVVFTAIWDVQIMEKIIGQYLDYYYDLRIEWLQRNGITASCHCCSDVDEILYTQIAYTFTAAEIANSYWHTNDSGSSSSSQKPTHPKGKGVPGTTYKVVSYPQQPTTSQADKIPKGFASMHAEKIAKALGKELVCQIDDFVSTVDVNQGGATFSDLIGDIFGWTSRIPTLLINCYLNDNKLYIIQRGYEANIIDISDTKHTVPVITQELVRTFWYGHKTYRTETRSVAYWEWVPDEDSDSDADDDDDDDDDTESPGTDEDTPAEQKFEFDEDGLVKKSYRTETIRNADGTITIIEVETDYDYITLKNGRKFLHKETTRSYIDQELIDENIVEHMPLDQGQSHTYVKDDEGYYLGSTVGRGKRDDRISKRKKVELPNDDTVDLNENEEDDNWQNTKTESQSRTIPGIVNFDTSFPVYGNEKLKAITEEIKRLNRQTKETVTVEIYNYNHVININDQIIFHGHTYFFENNTVTKTPRIVNKQTLTMVRWFVNE